MSKFLTDNVTWYVLHVKTKCEHKVKNDLAAIIASKGLGVDIVDVCVPELGKKVVYPGYVYVKMRMTDKAWYAVRNVSNVFGFIEAEKGQPLPLSAKEAARIAPYAEKPARALEKGGNGTPCVAGFMGSAAYGNRKAA